MVHQAWTMWLAPSNWSVELDRQPTMPGACSSDVWVYTSNYHLLANYHNPMMQHQLLFEICQFLVWAKRETGKHVVQKRIAAGLAIPYLDAIFGERAQYLITLRHPATACTSFSEMEGINEEAKPTLSPAGWKIGTLPKSPEYRRLGRARLSPTVFIHLAKLLY